MLDFIHKQTAYYLKQVARYEAFQQQLLDAPIYHRRESEQVKGLFFDMRFQRNWLHETIDVRIHAKADLWMNPMPENHTGVLKFVCGNE